MSIAVYARVSSEDQAERGTIANQVEFAEKYCDLHELRIAGWYKDDGVSGTISIEEREAGQRLLEDAEAGKFDTVLVYKLDRLGRSARIILNAVHELEQHGVKIKSMTEPFDTGDPSGRFLLTILAGVADLERENILSRMWHGANRAARKGKWLGGIVPYGYFVNDDGYLEINEEPLPDLDMTEADVVRLIYSMTADQGLSTIKIADHLNARGIPPSYAKDGRMVTRGKRAQKTAGVWRPGRIRNMLVNTTYKGLHRYGKRSNKQRDIITREVPAIVSEETWERAQQVLKQNQLEATRSAKHQYLLRGMIKCGECGLNYTGTHFGSGDKKKGYYVCNGKISYRGPKNGKCKSKNVPQQWVEDFVWERCVDFIYNPGKARDEIAATMKERKSNTAQLEAEKQAIQKAKLDKGAEKERILELYRKGIIGHSDVEKQLEAIKNEEVQLAQREAELERQLIDEAGMDQKYETADSFLGALRQELEAAGETPSFAVKRMIVKALIDEVVVVTRPGTGKRPSAELLVHFSFFQDVIRTDKRAQSNLEIAVTKRASLDGYAHGYIRKELNEELPGDRIRGARLQKGLTIEELASKIGISVTALGRIENNRGKASLPTLRRLSQKLEQPLWYLGAFEKLPEETLGQQIRKRRHYLGLTKKELAAHLNVNVRTIRSWENDSVRPSAANLQLVRQLLEMV